MNYDDRRGNLHIHFKKGLQHLTGESRSCSTRASAMTP